jgi:sigma-B regulation protein RsbU (phosphoserine phosphatase)
MTTTPPTTANTLAPELDPSRLEALLESAQLLHSSLDLEDLLKHLLRSVMGRVLTGRGLIAVAEDGAMRLRLVRGFKTLRAGAVFDEQAAREAGMHVLYAVGDPAHPAGLLGLGRPPQGEISLEEEQFLKALLGIAASGIANANAHAESHRLNQDLEQKIQELRALLDLVRGLSSTLEPEEAASLLMFTLAGRWAVRKYCLAAWKEHHPTVVRQKGLTLQNPEQFKPFLLELPEAITVADLPDSDFKQTLLAQQAALVFPLRTGEALTGVVILGPRAGKLDYTEADLEFGAGLVAQAGVAFENAWYVRETLERKKIEQELELAASIQQALFPAFLPRLEGYELAAHNRPARQCGGDYYDVLPVENGGQTAFLFCVADVSGKGLPASLLMSNVQATLRALLGHHTSLAELSARTSELLYATTPSNKYVTAIMAQVELESGSVRYVNAGHSGGLLLRASGEHLWLKPTGTPIGLLPGMPYDEERIQLERGDLLALFSDGIPEAQNERDEEYGEDRFLEYVRTAQSEPSQTIVSGAFAEIEAFTLGVPQFDDITLLVIKKNS